MGIQTMGNDKGKLFFNVALTIALVGLLFHFIQDIIIWARIIEPGNLIAYGTPITIVIADVVVMIMLILIIVLLYIGTDKILLLRIAIIAGAMYLYLYNLSHIFFPFYEDSAWDLGSYAPNIVRYFSNYYGLSFITLLVVGLVSLFLIILSTAKINEDFITYEEKFTYILTLVVMFVFDISCIHWVKTYAKDTYSYAPAPYYGFLHTPIILEMIIFIALILLLVASMFQLRSEYSEVLTIILVNTYFITSIATLVVGSILNFTTDINIIVFPIGNYLIIIGTVLIFASSIINIKYKLEPQPAK
jgi:hypothetical protein